MFTGIIEALGEIKDITESGSNKTFWIHSPLSHLFKVDQSISHNGVCLTVEEIEGDDHRVTAVEETLRKTALGTWKPGDRINLEQSLTLGSRLDGHFVQGHVDTTGNCSKIEDCNGSFELTFSYPESFAPLIIEKGSICVDGISLTAFAVAKASFKVAIIPYTWQHTNLQYLKAGDGVNLEFDLIGKYILRKMAMNP
ncbi:MAG: riboflavin synthase [Bacteroidota bacterium]|nr:riboflavin synthase [Flavisolibacter sp.]MBD0374042.1 riboflavin synthase [Flavisolibacter sp.]MDQ3844580.1 riboflavin synthase [Bacteroidota bacterium]